MPGSPGHRTVILLAHEAGRRWGPGAEEPIRFHTLPEAFRPPRSTAQVQPPAPWRHPPTRVGTLASGTRRMKLAAGTGGRRPRSYSWPRWRAASGAVPRRVRTTLASIGPASAQPYAALWRAAANASDGTVRRPVGMEPGIVSDLGCAPSQTPVGVAGPRLRASRHCRAGQCASAP